MNLAPPIAHLAEIERAELNRALVAWGHRIGQWNRPQMLEWHHGLFHNGRLVAVTATASLIRETCAGLTRDQAIELGRLCASDRHLCRPMLRLWREFVFRPLAERRGWTWAVSYQDAVMHTGNTYRMDGWVRIGAGSSGPDSRSGRQGRKRVIWGYCLDADQMIERVAA